MLKKKILGAKVLDTNGYVLATRLIVPTDVEKEYSEIQQRFNLGTSSPTHQLGDIYNANMVDVVAKAVSQGDTLLNQQIETETAARIAADRDLSNKITLEIADRKKAITDLINGAPEMYDTLKEISDYISSDKDFASSILKSLSTETSERKAADSSLSDDIAAETSRAESIEETLLNAINSLNSGVATEGSVAYAVATETTRAENAEKDLSTAISAEITRAESKESELSTSVSQEVQDRKDAIDALTKRVIVALQSSTYDKDTNVLTLIFVKGDGSTVTYTTNLGDIIDANDLVSSDTTTAARSDGKSSVSVNAMSTEDVLNIINN